MFTESETETDMDFIPQNGQWICKKCIHYVWCPREYRCETYKRIIRWELESLDDDDTL